MGVAFRRAEEQGGLEAVNLRELRGSRIANDFAGRRGRQPVHGGYVLIEQAGKGPVIAVRLSCQKS
jgi:hypothetical protein